jgi:transposase
LRRLKRGLEANRKRVERLHAVSLQDIPGFGPITTAAVLGSIGDVDRFASHHCLAAFAGVAPKQIASGAHERHRLDRLGNHYLKRAVHTVAMVQARIKNSVGRGYYLKKIAEGKTHREALRCLKRQLVKVIWRTLRVDARQRDLAVPVL